MKGSLKQQFEVIQSTMKISKFDKSLSEIIETKRTFLIELLGQRNGVYVLEEF